MTAMSLLNRSRRCSMVASFVHFSRHWDWWQIWPVLKWLENRRIYWQSRAIATSAPGWRCVARTVLPSMHHPNPPMGPMGALGMLVALILVFVFRL